MSGPDNCLSSPEAVLSPGDRIVRVSLRGGLSQQGAAESSSKDEGWSNCVNVSLAVGWTLD